MNRSNRKRPRPGRRRRAALLIIACVALASTLIVSGLVIDVGNLNVARTELQRGADAAALAAVGAMMTHVNLNGVPNPSTVAHHARNAATEYVLLNPCRGVTSMTLPRNDANAPDGDLVLGHYNSATGAFNPNDTRYNSVEILLRRDNVRNGPIPLFFGGLIGLPAVNAFAQSAAFVETNIRGFRIEPGSNARSKLLPFSLQINMWNQRGPESGDTHTHNPLTHVVTNGRDGIFEVSLFPHRLAPGNFGTVDIGHSGNSAADLRRQILCGPNSSDFSFFPNNTVELNNNGILMLNGDTGATTSMKSEIGQIIGQPRIIPLHATVSGQGNNAWFQVVAFVGVTIVDFRLTGASRDRFIKIQPCRTTCNTAVGGGAGVTSNFLFGPPTLRVY